MADEDTQFAHTILVTCHSFYLLAKHSKLLITGLCIAGGLYPDASDG